MKKILIVSSMLLFLSVAASAATFTVTNCADADPASEGTLRWAIEQANGGAGPHLIEFNIPEGVPGHSVVGDISWWTIQPLTPLPAITSNSVHINGNTQKIFIGGDPNPFGPEIEIDAFTSLVGLVLVGNQITIEGLVVNRASYYALFLNNSSHIKGNYLGTDISGSVPLWNDTGIRCQGSGNLIGGTGVGEGNVISSNTQYGIYFDDTASNNSVKGNYIGTTASGEAALGNGTYGIFLRGPSNLIGGSDSASRNIISGNAATTSTAGIMIDGEGHSNEVKGNYVGLNSSGTGVLANSFGIGLNGVSWNLIGGILPAERNIISGNASGVVFFSANSNEVQGNYIGTDPSGSFSLGNHSGVVLTGTFLGSFYNLIGGINAGEGNLISGNSTGLSVSYGGRNIIQGNLIGLNATGTAVVANAEGVVLGGNYDLLNGGNVISGNNAGIQISGNSNEVKGNYIGTDPDGNTAKGNYRGIILSGRNNLIGGEEVGERNIISGNDRGIEIFSGQRHIIKGNYIGINASGLAALANNWGVVLQSGESSVIGGSAAAARNVVSGNTSFGIMCAPASSSSEILGNYIGTNATGNGALGNGVGVWLYGQHHLLGPNNLIAYNSSNVLIDSAATYNVMTRNRIFSAESVELNIALGGNNGITRPTILSATPLLVNGTAEALASVEVFLASRPAGDFGGSQAYLGTATADPYGNWSIAVSGLSAGDKVTATQTHNPPPSYTSDFAVNYGLPTVSTTTSTTTTSTTTTTTTTSTTTTTTISELIREIDIVEATPAAPASIKIGVNVRESGYADMMIIDTATGRAVLNKKFYLDLENSDIQEALLYQTTGQRLGRGVYQYVVSFGGKRYSGRIMLK